MTEFQPPAGLAAAAAAVADPDPEASHAARLRQQRLVVPAGSLGILAELAVWAAGVQGGCPPREFQHPRLTLFAAEHGIAAAGVAATGESTERLLRLVADGRAAVNAIAAELPVRVVDLAAEPSGARRASGRLDVEDALDADQVTAAVATGMAAADQEIEAGAELLLAGSLAVAAGTPAAALVAVLTDTEPARLIGRGEGIDDAGWIRKCAAVRDARRRAWPHRNDPLRLLAVAGGADLAALTGFLVQAAGRRVPVLLDGLVPCAAALIGQLACPRAVRWWLAGQQSDDPAHELALRRLGLTPVLRLGVRLDQGVGALLALPVLQAAVRTLSGIASRDESAGPDQAG